MRPVLLAAAVGLLVGTGGCFNSGGSDSAVFPQRTFYVDIASNTGIADGSQNNPFRLIQDGLDRAARGDRVVVAAGTYSENLNFVRPEVSLIGAGASLVTVQGDGTRTVIDMPARSAGILIQGLTITGGFDRDAGALDANNCQVSLLDCVVTGNATGATAGGAELFVAAAVRFQQGIVKIRRCSFVNNQSRGLSLTNARDVIVENCIFAMNDSDGLYLTGRTTTSAPDLVMTNATFQGNGDNGFEMDNFADARVTNVIFSGNVVGLWESNDAGDPLATYLDVEDGYRDADTATILTAAADLNGLDPPGTNTGIIVDPPQFVDAPAGDLHLLAGSPCIDTGDPALLDPDGSRSDMGAFGGPRGDWDPTAPLATAAYWPAPSVQGDLWPLLEVGSNTARPGQPLQRDLNGDGFTDHLEIRQGRARSWLGTRHGSHRPGPMPDCDAPVRSIAVHDLDGDGSLDLLVETDRGLEVHLHRARHDGTIRVAAQADDVIELDLASGRRLVQRVVPGGDDRWQRTLVGVGREVATEVRVIRGGKVLERWSAVEPGRILDLSPSPGASE